MAAYRVKGERETEADNSANEENTKQKLLLQLYLQGGMDEEVSADANKCDAPDQMCPDVAGLRVDAKYALETIPKAGQRRSMAVLQVVVVLEPVRQLVKVTDVPARPDYLPYDLLRLVGGAMGETDEVIFLLDGLNVVILATSCHGLC